MGDYYVYLHCKADTGEVFYVGKGKGRRAWVKDRNAFWKHTVKRHGLVVKIYNDKLTEKEAFEVEVEVIASLKEKGVRLTNMTEGGEGSSHNDQTREKKQQILDFYQREGRLPSRRKAGEAQMYGWMSSYCSPACGSYDEVFDKEIKDLGHGKERVVQGVCDKKQILRDYAQKEGKFPPQRRSDGVKMHRWLSSYCCPASNSYDTAFAAEMRLLVGYGNDRVRIGKLDKQQAIREFIQTRGRMPSQSETEERYLARQIATYCSPASNAYDEAFDAEMRALGYGSNRGKRIKEKV